MDTKKMNEKMNKKDHYQVLLILLAYHIMKIIWGRTLSQLQRPVEIHGKTFTVMLFMQYLID